MQPVGKGFKPIGGKMERGETPILAFIRECKEETGLNIEDLKIVPIMSKTRTVRKRECRHHFFICTLSHEPAVFTTREVTPAWLPAKEIKSWKAYRNAYFINPGRIALKTLKSDGVSL
jgi:8-oxo-dGTP pyrophosphatase MutT (NUDIX family)